MAVKHLKDENQQNACTAGYIPWEQGSRKGAVVRALAFHQCGLSTIPEPGVISGLSLLVLYSAP